MFPKIQFLGNIILWGFLLITVSKVVAMPIHSPQQTSQFRSHEQPLGLKIGVTVGGLALIGWELWWFIGKQAQKSQQESGN